MWWRDRRESNERESRARKRLFGIGETVMREKLSRTLDSSDVVMMTEVEMHTLRNVMGGLDEEGP